jgi:hypothetical protein
MLRRTGYTLEEVPRAAFRLTDKMKEGIRRCGFNVIDGTMWEVLKINRDKHEKNCPDEDILTLYAGMRLFETLENRYDIYNFADDNLIAGMKNTYNEAAEDVKILRRKILAKYPFLSFRTDRQNDYRSVNEWLFSNLLPLLYPQSTEQSKLPKETTDLS